MEFSVGQAVVKVVCVGGKDRRADGRVKVVDFLTEVRGLRRALFQNSLCLRILLNLISLKISPGRKMRLQLLRERDGISPSHTC